MPKKSERKCAHPQKSKLPSFVYRQDGHELSYKVSRIVAENHPHVKHPEFWFIGLRPEWTMDNGQWTIKVFFFEKRIKILKYIAEGNTFIVNCQLSIFIAPTVR